MDRMRLSCEVTKMTTKPSDNLSKSVMKNFSHTDSKQMVRAHRLSDHLRVHMSRPHNDDSNSGKILDIIHIEPLTVIDYT
jgi:hypothetical protein